LLVYLAGHRDPARDPRLTTVALTLLAALPILVAVAPKIELLPASFDASGTSGTSWDRMIFEIWVAGFGLMMLRLGLDSARLIFWRLRSSRIDSMGSIEIRSLSTLDSPVAAGVFRQIIFVPAQWLEWPEETRRMVLSHETWHHRRRDPLWRWVAGISLAVNWYNPLVWWMVRRLKVQCEYACDACVLHQGVSARDYATLLCDLAECSDHGMHAIAIAGKTSLEGRVKRLMSATPAKGLPGVIVMISCVVACAMGLVFIGQKNRPAESFSQEEVKTRWAANPFPDGN